MPLYEYQCKKCRNKFEKIQKFSDPPVRKCPKCGGPVEKLLSAPAVQFKGTGWYVTDYGRKGQSNDRGPSESKPGEKKPETAADSSTSSKKESGESKQEKKQGKK